jgi:hypothetical protein
MSMMRRGNHEDRPEPSGVPAMVRELATGLAEEEANGRVFKAFVAIVVDDAGKWAAMCSGIDLDSLRTLLQHARDDAVLGGEGYSVVVPIERAIGANDS